jgi:hypothetical protein
MRWCIEPAGIKRTRKDILFKNNTKREIIEDRRKDSAMFLRISELGGGRLHRSLRKRTKMSWNYGKQGSVDRTKIKDGPTENLFLEI